MSTTNKDGSFDQKMLENDKKQYRETNTVLLVFHILLAIPYYIVSPVNMTFVSVFGILFYLSGYIIISISKKSLLPYSIMILLEIFFHSFSCTLILGWQCGFQYWIFAMTCTYLKNYLLPGNSQNYRNTYSRIVLMTGFITYIGIYLLSNYVDFPYTDYPSKGWTTFFVIINTLLTLSALGAFTRIYSKQMEYKYSILYNKADIDALTGLGNRYYLNEVLTEEEQFCNDISGYSIAILDIDDFKKVNDTYGHNNGDLVLRELATLLSSNLPDDIEVGRWGGEEFLVISKHKIKYNDFITFIDLKREKISKHRFILEDRNQIKCTISVGTSCFKQGLEIRNVIKQADDNLYIAKTSGKNKVCS